MTDDRKRYEDARLAYGGALLSKTNSDEWRDYCLWRIAEALESIASTLPAAIDQEDGEDWRQEADEDE